MLSRQDVLLKNEWRLAPNTFKWVCDNSPWGSPEVDLFANRLNTQLPLFFSPCQDKEALGVDALLCPWPNRVCYAFPPTTILDKVATKILLESPQQLLLVAPWWPNKSWFPVLQENAWRIALIPEESLRLIQPHFAMNMPNPMSLSLALWCITCRD